MSALSLALVTVALLPGCRREDPTPPTDTVPDGTGETGVAHTGAGTATHTGAPTDTRTWPEVDTWWFQVFGTGQVHLGGACAFADPFAGTGWDPRWTAVVGWFDGTVTLGEGSATETSLVADGVDGFVAVLDPARELDRVIVLGGPGAQRALRCGASDGLYVVGTFGGALTATGLGDTLVPATDADAFAYRERIDPYDGSRWLRSLEHVVAGRVTDLSVTYSLFRHRVFGAFEGAITVWPGTPEAWSATSEGESDGFYARPSRPLLLAGPGRETLRAVATWTSSSGPGIFRVDRSWLAGSAAAGATLVNDGAETALQDTFGDGDAWVGYHAGWLDDAEGAFEVSTRGGPGTDEVAAITYVSDQAGSHPPGTYLLGTFDGGLPGASTPWGSHELVGVGGRDVLLSREEDGRVAETLVVGSPGDDPLGHARFSMGYQPGGGFVTGGLLSGRFSDGAFTAPGLPPVDPCGPDSTWALTFAYGDQDGYAPTWLGRGCGLEVVELSAHPDDAVAFVVANHGAGATLELPTRLVTPPDPPPGGAGAFVAAWGP